MVWLQKHVRHSQEFVRHRARSAGCICSSQLLLGGANDAYLLRSGSQQTSSLPTVLKTFIKQPLHSFFSSPYDLKEGVRFLQYLPLPEERP